MVTTVNTWKNWVDADHSILKSMTSADNYCAHQLGLCLKAVHEVVSTASALADGPQARTVASMPLTQLTLPTTTDQLPAYQLPVKAQHKLTVLHSKSKQIHLLRNIITNPSGKAQYLSKLGFGAAAVFVALPAEGALKINNEQMTLILRLWLRLPLVHALGLTDNTPCGCNRFTNKNEPVMCSDSHLLLCNNGGSFGSRHQSLVRELTAMLAACKMHFKLEPMADVTGKQQLRFDFAAPGFSNTGGTLLADVSVRNPLAQDAVNHASNRPLYAADRAWDEKFQRYSGFIDGKSSDIFLPLVFETFGAMHRGIEQYVSTLASRVCWQPPPQALWTSPTFTAYWMQRLSCCLWRENARNVMRVAALTKLAHSHGALTPEDLIQVE